MSLLDAVHALSEAHGPKALAAAFHTLEGQVRRTRRAAREQYWTLAQTFTAAMRIWDAQKADGVALPDRLAGLEQSMRASWPRTREWKYLCQDCRDYGLRMRDCSGDATCGRIGQHLAHEVGMPCWCPAGSKFRDKPKPSAEDFTQAGKSKLTKIGR